MSLPEISVCGAVLILIGAVLRLRLPKDACMVLWWSAAVRLLLPFPLPFRWSVYTFLKTLAAAKTSPSPAAPPVTFLPSVESLPVSPVMPSMPTDPEPFPLRTVLWLAGTLLLGCWFAVSYFRWRRRFREALPVDSGFVRQWCGTRPFIRVRVSDRIDAPLTYGVFRPVILLPKNFPIHDETALLCVLTHERIHIQRLDGLLKLLLASALCVHWFNPAVWVLWVLAGRDMELRCDQAALSSLGPERKAPYALTLLRMAELRNESMPLSSSFCQCGLEERIHAIMKFKKTSLLTLTAALALTLCVTAAFATTAWKEPAPGEPSGKLNEAGTMSEAMFALRSLEDSIRFEDGAFYFTIPSGETDGNRWNIWISGRVLTAADEDSGMIMSVHYLENESEKGEWVSGKTYSFQTADAAYGELTMTAALGDEEFSVDLTPYMPDGVVPLETPELPESKENIPEDAEMVWPVDSSEITNDFGARANPGGEGAAVHNGVDIGGLDSGEPVYAAEKGTVKAAGFDSHDGNYILLEHAGDVETYYSSCQKILVRTGDAVELGQLIATAGQSGMSTGPHLHFEIRKNGVPQNPIIAMTRRPGETTSEEAPLLAETDGTVLCAYQMRHDGFYTLVLNGSDGREYTYYNCRSLQVSRGDAVKAGDMLGTANNQYLIVKSVECDPEKQARKAAELDALAKEYLVDGQYPVNKNGQTYAPNESLTAVVGYPPDLVSGIATNGQKGYIPLDELNNDSHLMWGIHKYQSDPDAAESRGIPVYDEAGDVIGEFVIGAGAASGN